MNTIEHTACFRHQGAFVPGASVAAEPTQGWLTVDEAALALGMSFRQVVALIEAGVIVPEEDAATYGGEDFARSAFRSGGSL